MLRTIFSCFWVDFEDNFGLILRPILTNSKADFVADLRADFVPTLGEFGADFGTNSEADFGLDSGSDFSTNFRLIWRPISQWATGAVRNHGGLKQYRVESWWPEDPWEPRNPWGP
jgi:hypothetical protein